MVYFWVLLYSKNKYIYKFRDDFNVDIFYTYIKCLILTRFSYLTKFFKNILKFSVGIPERGVTL